MQPPKVVYVVFVVNAEGRLAYDEQDRAYLWADEPANRQAARDAAHKAGRSFYVRVDRPVAVVL